MGSNCLPQPEIGVLKVAEVAATLRTKKAPNDCPVLYLIQNFFDETQLIRATNLSPLHPLLLPERRQWLRPRILRLHQTKDRLHPNRP